jgi:hypothetical protein
MCRTEWDNPAAEDQGRRLVLEWTVSLLTHRFAVCGRWRNRLQTPRASRHLSSHHRISGRMSPLSGRP